MCVVCSSYVHVCVGVFFVLVAGFPFAVHVVYFCCVSVCFDAFCLRCVLLLCVCVCGASRFCCVICCLVRVVS